MQVLNHLFEHELGQAHADFYWTGWCLIKKMIEGETVGRLLNDAMVATYHGIFDEFNDEAKETPESRKGMGFGLGFGQVQIISERLRWPPNLAKRSFGKLWTYLKMRH
jgi:hypothetical protein